MKAIVTGGLGFIGSHLVERLLRDGFDVVILDNLITGKRSNLEKVLDDEHLQIVEADVAEYESIKLYFENVDCVFHLAALADIVPSIHRPLDYYRSNVTGTISVLEAARAANVGRFVYVASSSCYGTPTLYPTPETALIQPQYPYALTKYLGENITLHWGKVYKMNVLSMRLFNVYGVRSRTTGAYGAVFGVFLAQKFANKSLTVVGDGNQSRDFTYVDDIVEALLAGVNNDHVQNEVFNVGSGGTYSVNYLADLIGGSKVFIPKRPGEPDRTWADISKIQRMLRWKPKVSFEEGVRRMLERIGDWMDAPIWTPESIADATQDWFRYLSQSKSE